MPSSLPWVPVFFLLLNPSVVFLVGGKKAAIAVEFTLEPQVPNFNDNQQAPQGGAFRHQRRPLVNQGLFDSAGSKGAPRMHICTQLPSFPSSRTTQSLIKWAVRKSWDPTRKLVLRRCLLIHTHSCFVPAHFPSYRSGCRTREANCPG